MKEHWPTAPKLETSPILPGKISSIASFEATRIAAGILRVEERRIGDAVGNRLGGNGEGIKPRHRGPP
jgi:hypothetical protein